MCLVPPGTERPGDIYLFCSFTGKPFPPLSVFFLENAIPLIAYLRALPDIGPKIVKDVEFAYADCRATFMEDSLRNCGRDVLVDATPAQGASLGRRGLGRFLDVLFALAKVRPFVMFTEVAKAKC